MRYVLVDRITSLAPGQRITAIKNVSASDDLVTRYGHGLSAMPSTMVLEAMAQAAGLLTAASIDCAAQPMLAKVHPFSSYGLARSGDRIVLRAELDELRDEGCVCRATASIDERRLATATIYLALVPLSIFGGGVSAEPLRLALADAFPGWFAARALQESAR
jgi:3-hydroxymyristoyl/3-hydroxydecanoyl-(acyl carrier protein) dehydratase